jgi:hypothetical protein
MKKPKAIKEVENIFKGEPEMDLDHPANQEYEPQENLNQAEGSGQQQAEQEHPMMAFERDISQVIRAYSGLVPLPLVVGFLDLKLIELKESFRLQVEGQLRALREAQTHGNA